MSLRLLDYDLSQSTSGLIFGIMPICLAAGTLAVPLLIPKWVEPRVTLISGLFMLAFGTILTGPFFTELNLTAMMIGLGLMGFFEGVLLIPNMQEMMVTSKEAWPTCDLEHTNSLLSGLLSSAFGGGMAVGPLLGSFFFSISDFRMTMNYMAIIVVTEAILYTLCAGGFSAVRLTCKNYSQSDPKRSYFEDQVSNAVDFHYSHVFRKTLISTKDAQTGKTSSFAFSSAYGKNGLSLLQQSQV